jgi:hypothetical protein
LFSTTIRRSMLGCRKRTSLGWQLCTSRTQCEKTLCHCHCYCTLFTKSDVLTKTYRCLFRFTWENNKMQGASAIVAHLAVIGLLHALWPEFSLTGDIYAEPTVPNCCSSNRDYGLPAHHRQRYPGFRVRESQGRPGGESRQVQSMLRVITNCCGWLVCAER